MRAVGSVLALTKTSTEHNDGPFRTEIEPNTEPAPSAPAHQNRMR